MTVADITIDGAFDKVLQQYTPFDAVLHVASPFRFDVKDVEQDILAPALKGTTGILKSVKKFAPTVKRVVMTSSLAAIVDISLPGNGFAPGYAYTEDHWNPMTYEVAKGNAWFGYVGSKALAEKSAWEFMRTETPQFDLVVLNPPPVFGPIRLQPNPLDGLNTSNQSVYEMMLGKHREGLPPTLIPYWIDVRDLARLHLNALEVPDASGRRFLTTAGTYSVAQVADIVRGNFKEFAECLPVGVPGGDLPALDGCINDPTRWLLGQDFITLEECIVDLVKSLKQSLPL